MGGGHEHIYIYIHTHVQRNTRGSSRQQQSQKHNSTDHLKNGFFLSETQRSPIDSEVRAMAAGR